jgi:hypothetical protein
MAASDDKRLRSRSLEAEAKDTYGNLPARFEANQGQADSTIKFILRGNAYTAYLRPSEAIMSLSKWSGEQSDGTAARSSTGGLPREASNKVVGTRDPANTRVMRLRFIGASVYAKLTGEEEFTCSTGGHTYERVRCEDIYPNVTLVLQGNHREFRYSFILAPGADPRTIKLRFDADGEIRDMWIDASGALAVATRDGDFRQNAPVIYQEADGIQRDIEGSHEIRPNHEVSIRVAAFDPKRPLIIEGAIRSGS